MPTPKHEAERRAGGYDKRPNELITAREAVLLIDTRVSVLLAHWEDERRKRERARRPLYHVRRWLGVAWAMIRPAPRARGVSLGEQLQGVKHFKAGTPPRSTQREEVGQ